MYHRKVVILYKVFCKNKVKPYWCFLQAEQQKLAAIVSAEGDAQGAALIAKSFKEAGEGLIELRRIEAAEEIADKISTAPNVAYLPHGNGMLLNLPAPWTLQ